MLSDKESIILLASLSRQPYRFWCSKSQGLLRTRAVCPPQPPSAASAAGGRLHACNGWAGSLLVSCMRVHPDAASAIFDFERMYQRDARMQHGRQGKGFL